MSTKGQRDRDRDKGQRDRDRDADGGREGGMREGVNEEEGGGRDRQTKRETRIEVILNGNRIRYMPLHYFLSIIAKVQVSVGGQNVLQSTLQYDTYPPPHMTCILLLI